MIAIFYCMFIALVDHIYEAKVTVIHQGDKHVMKKNHLLTITILTWTTPEPLPKPINYYKYISENDVSTKFPRKITCPECVLGALSYWNKWAPVLKEYLVFSPFSRCQLSPHPSSSLWHMLFYAPSCHHCHCHLYHSISWVTERIPWRQEGKFIYGSSKWIKRASSCRALGGLMLWKNKPLSAQSRKLWYCIVMQPWYLQILVHLSKELLILIPENINLFHILNRCYFPLYS